MTGRPDYDAGDLVVCVEDAPFTCPHNIRQIGRIAPKIGSIHRVVALIKNPVTSGKRAGEFCGCLDAVLEGGKGGNTARFRRIDPKPPEFFAGKIETV